jgi:hypothetical protein
VEINVRLLISRVNNQWRQERKMLVGKDSSEGGGETFGEV